MTASELARIEAYILTYAPSAEVQARAAVVGHIAVVHDFEGLMGAYSDWSAEARLMAADQWRDAGAVAAESGEKT
jgi:hypothetical protein